MTDATRKKTFPVRLATDADDQDIRELLRNNPMPGEISLTLEREPRYSYGEAVEGDEHQTIIAHRHGKAIGIGSRSTRGAYINGAVQKLGYLSQLRIAQNARGTRVFIAGYRVIADLHKLDDCPFYITTIISDNKQARSLLERDWKPKPTYQHFGKFSTLLLPVRRKRKSRPVRNTEIRPATARDLPRIADCLQRNYSRFQFAPHWTAEALADSQVTRGLEAHDFTVAVQDDRIVGCLAIWDQQGFKQTVVRGYDGKWKYLRLAYNLAAPIIGTPNLPPAGSVVPHAYLSHVAVDGNDIDLYLALLTKACNKAAQKKYAYLALGLAEGNPLLPVTKKRFRHVEYESIIYLVYYKENQAAAKKVEMRTPHLELAVL